MATFTVNTSQDVVNANDGVLSLREAITAAASLPGRDTIQIATDLVFRGATLPTLTQGNDIDFVGTTDATGGDTRRALTRQNTSRLFTIDGASVSFTNLTLQGGRAVGLGGVGGGGGGAGLGGAITILSGSLFVNDVIFANNQAIGGSSTGTAGNGGRGGNDSGNGFNGFSGGQGGSSNLGLGLGAQGGAGGTASVISGGVASGAFSGGRGSDGGFAGGGGAGGGGGGGAGGAGAFRRASGGGGGADGGLGGFGGGGGGGGGAGGSGANVLGGSVAPNQTPGSGGVGGQFGGNGGAGGAGGVGLVTFDGDSGGAGGIGGRGGGGAGLGGAIFNRSGFVTIVNSRFVDNRAAGGTGFQNGQGVGGAVFSFLGRSVTLSGVTFESNVATNSGTNTGSADGEALNVLPSPIASLSVPSSVAENSSSPIQAQVLLDRVPLVSTTINFTLSGTAKLGQDFTGPSGQVVIPAGALSANIPIQILDDQLFDPNESLTLTLTPGRGYGISTTQPSGTLVIVDDEVGGPVDPSGQWLGEGGARNFIVRDGQQRIAIDFQGIGRGINPSADVIQEVDTIQFEGKDLIAKNLLLTQQGDDLLVSFVGNSNTSALLKNFKLENLENLSKTTGATIDLGNILFDGQSQFSDSFDVFNADETRNTIFNRNTVTFLNDLDNTVVGFNNSDDVINGQGGDDKLNGLGGNDLLRGGQGKDWFIFKSDRPFRQSDLGIDTIGDFELGQDSIVLSRSTFTGLKNRRQIAIVEDDAAAAVNAGLVTYSRSSGNLFFNENGIESGFGSGGQFATLQGKPELTTNSFRLMA